MLQNLHTHTTFCDGKSTPEEIIEKAIELGFDSIGFSSHAPTILKTDWELSGAKAYAEKINALKKQYSEKIKIFLGVELDYFSDGIADENGYDFKIGSVHTGKCGDTFIDFDASIESTRYAIKEFFSRNPLKFAEHYYSLLADLPNKMDFDVVGHFDLITKFSEIDEGLIPTESKEYRRLATEALHAVCERVMLFEVNTGAISRGYRKTPYPAPFLLDEMKELGCKIVLSSDCHHKDFLDFGFEEAKELLKSHGFDELYYLTDKGFSGEKI